MTAITERLTLDEYLNYNDGTDTTYELLNGELIPMALPTGKQGAITKFLERTFDTEINRLGQEWIALQALVGVQSPRADRWDTVRIIDVSIIEKEQWRNLQNREAVIRLNETPPILVVEIVSESTKTTDYRAKRAEYCVLDISEYWIVDSLQSTVTVLSLSEGWYDSTEFTQSDRILSPTFPEISLTVTQLLQGQI